jgi:hypothetical protein
MAMTWIVIYAIEISGDWGRFGAFIHNYARRKYQNIAIIDVSYCF